jgi:hypothetical protein
MKKLFLAIAVIGAALMMQSCKKQTPPPAPEPEPVVEKIDKERIEKILTEISECSSNGGDYEAMEKHFTDTIFPHPSKQKRFRHNIAEKTQKYVEKFPMYEVSAPKNIEYLTEDFPLTVQCEVEITWIKDWNEYEALMRKTYYITEDYKISGYEDKEHKRKKL